MPTQDRILTGSAPAGARCLFRQREARKGVRGQGEAHGGANSERQKEIAEARLKKALEEKKKIRCPHCGGNSY
jgi:hypothetical protein